MGVFYPTLSNKIREMTMTLSVTFVFPRKMVIDDDEDLGIEDRMLEL